jgi:broad specificity phosphatase PhoE
MMKNNDATTFYIVRHGETDWNVQRKLQGQTDIPLNENGEAQAKEVAKKFKDIKFDLAYSSDLLRAKRTADIILLEKALLVQTTVSLRERKFGTLEGEPSEVFFQYIRELKNKTREERLKHRIVEDYENDEELASRVVIFLRETAIANPGKTILITTHGGVFHSILHHLGIYSYADSDNLRIKNTAHIRLESDGVEFLLKDQDGLVDHKEWILRN